MAQNDSRRRMIEQLTQQLRQMERARKIAPPPLGEAPLVAMSREATSGDAPHLGGDEGVGCAGLGDVAAQEAILSVAVSEPAFLAADFLAESAVSPIVSTGFVSAGFVSTGIAALDRLLPERGLRRGSLVEWFSEGAGSGAETLAISAARQALQTQGALVVIDVRQEFYAPAAAGHGIDLSQLILVRPDRDADVLWACDQSLRCPGVAVVLCEISRLNDRAFRRLQLAAEQGGSLGLLLRPASLRTAPSWADVRLFVQPILSGAGRRLRVEVLRCRGGMSGQSIQLEVDDETGLMRLVPELAPAAAVRRASRA